MPNQFLIHEKSLSFAAETTPCVPPSDWVAGGTPIEFVSVTLDGVKEELLVDPTAESRAFAVGNRARRKGRRNGTFGLVLKLHGVGEVTADGEMVTQTYLGTLLEHCFGGSHLGTSHTISATPGTATVPILDAVTGIVPGCMLAFSDISSPSSKYDGFPVCRRVLAVDAGTKAVTLSEALPWAPAEDDPVHACITSYLSAHTLRDAVAAGGLLSWYVKLGDTSALQWELQGCVANAKLEGLSPGGLPTLSLDGMNANFRNGAADGITDIPDLGVPEGHPQLSMSLDVSLSIQEVGTTAVNEVDANAITFEPGIARSKVETTTGKTKDFHGLATFSVSPNQTKFTCTIAAYTNEWYLGLSQDKAYRLSFTQPGAGAGAGSGFSVHLPNARLVSTPGRADVGDNHGLTLEFEASESNDTTGGSNVDLQKSRFLIAMF